MVVINKYLINLNDIIISNEDNYEKSLPNDVQINYLNKLKNEWNTVIIWNTRSDEFRELTIQQLSSWNVNYDILLMEKPSYCKYTAMIIEPRCHPALELVLKNFNKNLNEDWQFLIFHGNNNLDHINNIINQHEFNDRQIKLKHHTPQHMIEFLFVFLFIPCILLRIWQVCYKISVFLKGMCL